MWAPLLSPVLIASSARAFFRMPCNTLTIERVDPIVSPGAVAGHLHHIAGGSGFNFTESYADARASTCATCKARQDLSNYWYPELFFQAQNGSFTPVDNGGVLVYYLQRPNPDNSTILAFPEGFRMLAGDPNLRSRNDSDVTQQAVQYVCLGTSGLPTDVHPKQNCADGLRLQIFFPSCWDGVNVDSTDHKSHMAYPSGMDNGSCPPSHPARLISIFFETVWNTPAFADEWWRPDGSAPFVLSHGDETLYGFHGDYLNGWDVPSLQKAIDECTTDSGVIEDCASIIDLRTDDEMNECVLPPRVDEPITGWLPALPGCNPIQPGPQNAVPVSPCPAPPILSFAEASFLQDDIPGWTPVGCGRDNPTDRALTPERWTPPGMTLNELCTAHCKSLRYIYAGTEWSQECYCGNTFDMSLIGLNPCNMVCAGNASEYCGGSQTLSVYKLTDEAAAANPPSTTSQTPTTLTGSLPPSTGFASPNADWTSLGCYFDLVSTRALQGTNQWGGGGSAMTNSVCINYCASKGFSMAGTEYAGECYCGDALIGSYKMADSQCSMACNGDKTSMCGGPGALNVFQHSVAVAPTTTTAATSTSASMFTSTTSKITTSIKSTSSPSTLITTTSSGAPAVETSFPSPNKLWESLGCFLDTVNPRSLHGTGMFTGDGGVMTTEACLAHCVAAGFTLAGTEYAGECYCGDELIGSQQLPDAKCNMSCNGNKSEICGAGGALNVYQLTGGVHCDAATPITRRSHRKRNAARHAGTF